MPEKDLLLPDLTIRGFRGLSDFTIAHMGRVTLLTGMNGIGKTTVLDAIRVYASRGRRSEFEAILDISDEIRLTEDGDGDTIVGIDWAALFHDRRLSDDVRITIGSEALPDKLSIETYILPDDEVDVHFRYSVTEETIRAIKVVTGGNDYIVGFSSQDSWIPQHLRRQKRESNPAITYQYLGPGILDNLDLVGLWDKIALTPDENRVREALSFAAAREVSGIAMVGDDRISQRLPGRRVTRRSLRPLVKFRDQDSRVPLRSLGDGALRFFTTALALANCRDGFLLIDEAENGLHYSIHSAFWRMVLRTAHDNNIQVVATTHSFDCIRGFARAANEFEDIEGRLVRISRRDGNLKAIDYTEQDLVIATERFIEVR